MLAIRETPTRLILTGPITELRELELKYRYRPDRYWMSVKYQIWKNHQDQILKATRAGDLATAGRLEAMRVGWDGWKSPVAVKSSFGGAGTAECTRGHLAGALEWARKIGIELDTGQVLRNPFAEILIDDVRDDLLAVPLNGEQWALQKTCIHAWLKHGMARVQVTVSGGKTAMFCAAAAVIKERFPNFRFLYFTPTERLVSQVYAEAKKFLPDWNITQFGGTGRDDTGTDMVVCTVSILRARHEALVKSGWYKTFGTLLIDECHGAPGPSFSSALLACSAYFRLSASDTTRQDNVALSLALMGLCGPIVGSINTGELIALDRIASPTLNIVSVPAWRRKFNELTSEAVPGSKAWALLEGAWYGGTYVGPVYKLDKDGNPKIGRGKKLIVVLGRHLLELDGVKTEVESRWCLLSRKHDMAIIMFKERNKLIAQQMAAYSAAGKKSLVIATRTLHVMILEAEIAKRVDRSLIRVLYSAHSSEERDETFKWLQSTPGAVLISPLVKVGVSINEITAGVIADFVADWEFMRQLIGRFIRHKPDGTPNEAEVTIFAEDQHSSYAAGAKRLVKRLKTVDGFKWKETTVVGEDMLAL